MTNKSSNWVTIPEEKIHTPVSKKVKKRFVDTSSEKVKNKLFWGAGFIVLVIFTAALLAPRQLASILQGNLFDSTSQGFDFIPEDSFEDPEITQVEKEPSSANNGQVSNSDFHQDEPEQSLVVEANTDAVSIEIDPIITQVQEDNLDKNIDQSDNLNDSQLDVQIEDSSDDISPSSIDDMLVPSDSEVNTDPAKDEIDANRLLLKQLSEQISEFKKKDEEKTKIMEDLIDITVNSDNTEIHASAPDVVDTTLELSDTSSTDTTAITTPPVSTTNNLAVTATTSFGESALGSDGYRVNTHTVNITPQQALAKHSAVQANHIPQNTLSVSESTIDYSDSYSRLDTTPESGPKESLLLALILSFISLLGWRLLKIIRA